MLVSEIVKTTLLTDDQIRRKITAATKAWLKDKGYARVTIQYIRGTYHATNHSQYLMSAKHILESATGFEFNPLGANMARLNPKHLNANN